MGKSQDLYNEALKIIPGGTQLFSKKAERFLPELWPAYFHKAEGCRLWDLDGKEYIDTGLMGIGSCILGYADKDVNQAVKQAIDLGSMTTLNCPEEVELTKKLCKLHPWANMARFTRCGGEAMAAAVRIARSFRRKDVILFCGYHGWGDWYLAANLADDRSLDGHLMPGLPPAGVPQGLKGTAIAFNYNDTDNFLSLFEKHKAQLAAVVMEPVRNHLPNKGFFETIRQKTENEQVPFILDEITAGWRLNVGGAHQTLGVTPDMAVFAKGMSNGFPMAAIIGKKELMEAANDTFISSTYWTERIGPTAALATIQKMEREKVPQYLEKVGRKVQAGWKQSALKHHLPLHVSGIFPLGHFSFDHKETLALKTLFIQIMLEKGFLTTTAFYASLAHTEKIVDDYLYAVDQAFAVLGQAMKDGNVKKFLKGPVCSSDFKRLN
ncbi:MAG: aminotransferase class III-fold pyridoxal phosphate-dependent enzyme [Candidatus Omnitrophica bacterium]|nr:aminotransferase class III-fold pyridoxal phosphate-dependent enzyme [Candidatus Omnitrophota bacterium]